MKRHYANPPIWEAVSEFKFSPDSPWDLTVPGLVYDKLRSEFPQKRHVKQVGIQTRLDESGVKQIAEQLEMTQLLRQDEKMLVQIGPNLMSVNHLKPYSTWRELRAAVRTAYDAYCAVANPVALQRIGLRYINRITTPGQEHDFETHFSYYPFLGKSLPQVIDSFILGVTVAYENEREGLKIQMSSSKPDKPDSVGVILDLDYSLRQPKAVPLTDALAWLDNAHERIAEAFEGCITDKLRKLFVEVK